MLIAKATPLDTEIFWMKSFILHYKKNDEKSSRYLSIITIILFDIIELVNDRITIFQADRTSLEIKIHLLRNAKQLFIDKTEVTDDLIDNVFNFLNNELSTYTSV